MRPLQEAVVEFTERYRAPGRQDLDRADEDFLIGGESGFARERFDLAQVVARLPLCYCADVDIRESLDHTYTVGFSKPVWC